MPCSNPMKFKSLASRFVQAQHCYDMHTRQCEVLELCLKQCAVTAVPNVGVPVSQMDDSYTKESATLSEAIIKYGTLDLYDPQRVQVINVSHPFMHNLFGLQIIVTNASACFC